METIEGLLDEQTRLLNSVKKQLELIGKYCPSLASRITFICILKLLEELIGNLKENAKDKVDIPLREWDEVRKLIGEFAEKRQDKITA